MHEINISRGKLEVAVANYVNEWNDESFLYVVLKEVIVTYKHGEETVTEKLEINTNTELILRFETE